MNQTLILLLSILIISGNAFGQIVEVEDDAPATAQPVGKQRASEYFQARKKAPASAQEDTGERNVASIGNPRYLALHIGTFLDSDGYKWGNGNQKDLGELNLGVTYRMGEWVNSMDFLFRAEYTTYGLDEGNARKLSFLGMLMFPDANSQFPLYFGAGLGAGIFMKQIDDESPLSLDYQLVAGARFFEIIDTIGFNVEFGLKNELHLLKDGQMNGVFIGAGTVFSF